MVASSNFSYFIKIFLLLLRTICFITADFHFFHTPISASSNLFHLYRHNIFLLILRTFLHMFPNFNYFIKNISLHRNILMTFFHFFISSLDFHYFIKLFSVVMIFTPSSNFSLNNFLFQRMIYTALSLDFRCLIKIDLFHNTFIASSNFHQFLHCIFTISSNYFHLLHQQNFFYHLFKLSNVSLPDLHQIFLLHHKIFTDFWNFFFISLWCFCNFFKLHSISLQNFHCFNFYRFLKLFPISSNLFLFRIKILTSLRISPPSHQHRLS